MKQSSRLVVSEDSPYVSILRTIPKPNTMAADPVDDLTKHEGWTATADVYQDLVGKCTMHGTTALIDIVNDLFPFTSSSFALDVGAGAGSLTACVQNKSSETRVLATDIAEGMLAEINKRAWPGVSTQKADAVTLDGLSDGIITHGLSSFAIQFAPDMEAAVRSLHRVIASGGTVGIAIWGLRIDWADAHDQACKRLNPAYSPAALVTKGSWRDEKTHEEVLRNSGFQSVGVKTVRMPFRPGSAKGACDYWFRGSNPVAAKAVGSWVGSGGSKEELEREYEKIIREEYGDGAELYADAVLGWGKKI